MANGDVIVYVGEATKLMNDGVVVDAFHIHRGPLENLLEKIK